jgi:tRNA 2-thiouridine synthesizing protein E
MRIEETAPAKVLSLGGSRYRVDEERRLIDPNDWDENFAREAAPYAGIPAGLNERHWEVIRFIRRFWSETGSCPTVFQTCRGLGLHVSGFQFLFPTGYQRGACLLAGVSYKAEALDHDHRPTDLEQGSYRIDLWGFLLDPDAWNERFALLKAREMKVPGGLTDQHWEVVRYLRHEFYRVRKIPTVYETCDAIGIELDRFEELFPDGYYRGAVKIAGLRPTEESGGDG